MQAARRRPTSHDDRDELMSPDTRGAAAGAAAARVSGGAQMALILLVLEIVAWVFSIAASHDF
jgi:hypothetical protein